MGKKRQEPRWEQCVAVVQSALGIALSNLYVDKYFANENKQMVWNSLNLFSLVLQYFVKDFKYRWKHQKRVWAHPQSNRLDGKGDTFTCFGQIRKYGTQDRLPWSIDGW